MEKLSGNTQEWLKVLGQFAPHIDEENSSELLMLGQTIEKLSNGNYFTTRWYMNAAGWRDLAGVCKEVAEWLESQNTPLPFTAENGDCTFIDNGDLR